MSLYGTWVVRLLLIPFHATFLALVPTKVAIILNAFSLGFTIALIINDGCTFNNNCNPNNNRTYYILAAFICPILILYVTYMIDTPDTVGIAINSISVGIVVTQLIIELYLAKYHYNTQLNAIAIESPKSIVNVVIKYPITKFQLVNSQILEDCLLCLTRNDPYYKTICGHNFCKECLDIWLRSHNTCPICVTTIIE